MSDFSMRCTVVDHWEDYSEKSFKVWKGDASAFWAKSIFEIGDMPNEFVFPKKAQWLVDKLEEKADKLLMEAA